MAKLAPLVLTADRLSKRFGRQWIIRDFSGTFSAGETIGVRGRNGSGKSTLLRLFCGQLSPSRGRVTWQTGGHEVPLEKWYEQVAWTGPYIEVVEELTVQEFLTFHYGLKSLRGGLTVATVLERIELRHAAARPLYDCSSGMRQRALLATALYANTPLLLLDEPTVTLDAEAKAWFERELRTYRAGRLVFIASNDEEDLQQCTQTINLGA